MKEMDLANISEEKNLENIIAGSMINHGTKIPHASLMVKLKEVRMMNVGWGDTYSTI